jgi:hypothetical protein
LDWQHKKYNYQKKFEIYLLVGLFLVKQNVNPADFLKIIKPPRFSLDPGSGIRDGEKSGSGIRDKDPGSASLVRIHYVLRPVLRIRIRSDPKLSSDQDSDPLCPS